MSDLSTATETVSTSTTTTLTTEPKRSRGRPKGVSVRSESYGELADMIQAARVAKGLGLKEVSESLEISVQFLSNIEHGRCSVPWNKLETMSHILNMDLSSLAILNLQSREDYKRFAENVGDVTITVSEED